MWSTLLPSIRKILRQEPVDKTEWNNMFKKVSMICQLNDGQGILELEKTLQDEISDYVKSAELRVIDCKGHLALLRSYIAEWQIFFKQCKCLSLPFIPFLRFEKCKTDNFITTFEHNKLNGHSNIVQEIMMNIWNDIIFNNTKDKLKTSVMNVVFSERSGESIDSQLVIGMLESYVNLPKRSIATSTYSANYQKYEVDEIKYANYKDNFLKSYIKANSRFYKSAAPTYLQNNGVDDYLQYASRKLKEEEDRARKYLQVNILQSVEKLMANCVNVLVFSLKDIILAECSRMLKLNEIEKLRLMFNLIDRIPSGVEPMLHDLEQYIVKTGLDEMKAAAETVVIDPEKFVDQLVGLFRRFNLLVTDAFNDDPRFCTAKDRGFKLVLNDTTIFKLELSSKLKTAPESKCPEFFALYCDSLLKKSTRSKKLTSNEIDDKLKGVILMLKFIVNKDVFMQFYRTFLSRRLLLQTSADSDKEESVVIWLREIGMPADYVNKLTKMFQDIKISQLLNEEFKEKQRSEGKPVADSINVTVLAAASWALQSDNIYVSLPTELEDYIPEIEEFYKSKHNGRKLKWHHSISTGIISFANRVGKFDLEVTSFQMAILFAYNERPKNRISFENLKLATQLSDFDLRKCLWSLVSFPKLKRQIILCNPEVKSPKDFVSDNEFWINQEFAIMRNGKPANRGKLSLIGKLQFSTRVNARDDDNLEILKLRELRIQEAIVKIMKTRKKIAYPQLITEIVELLKNMFVPATKMIKEQISFLINNQYIRRDNEDFNIFIYMA